MVMFVNGRGSAVMQGKKQIYPAQTVADLIAANGRGYEMVKQDKAWQKLAMHFAPADTSHPASYVAA